MRNPVGKRVEKHEDPGDRRNVVASITAKRSCRRSESTCICSMLNLWVESDRAIGSTHQWPLGPVLRTQRIN